MAFPIWIKSALWGGLAGGALLVGAFIGYFLKLNQRVVAGVMAFGSGALISAISFELIEEAYNIGGLNSTITGLLTGAVIYSAANIAVCKLGAKNRKRANLNNKINLNDTLENSWSIALGALIDGIPESIVIGLGLVQGGNVNIPTVASIFISNVPEALSSSAGMKSTGKKFIYIFKIWGGIVVISAISACVGYLMFKGCSYGTIAFINAIAAGSILTMIVDTMIPEAFEETHSFAGLITVLGFICAFIINKM